MLMPRGKQFISTLLYLRALETSTYYQLPSTIPTAIVIASPQASIPPAPSHSTLHQHRPHPSSLRLTYKRSQKSWGHPGVAGTSERDGPDGRCIGPLANMDKGLRGWPGEAVERKR
jgi:hypothetical protein